MRNFAKLLAIGTMLLSACSANQINTIVTNSQQNSSIASSPITIQDVPSDWKYFECPQKNYCGTLNFAFPSKSNGPLEIQEGSVVGSYDQNNAYFIISETNNNFTLDESAQCLDTNKTPENCMRKKEWISNFPNYSVLKFTSKTIEENMANSDVVAYLIKTQNHEYFVTGHAKTSDEKKFLDITMLNLKIDNSSEANPLAASSADTDTQQVQSSTISNSSISSIPLNWKYITLWDTETRRVAKLPNLSVPAPKGEVAYLDQGSDATIAPGPSSKVENKIVFNILYDAQEQMDGCNDVPRGKPARYLRGYYVNRACCSGSSRCSCL